MREQEIITLIRQRSEEGAKLLLQHYGPLMRYIIQPILHSPEDREECLSEAAMRVWDKIDTYDETRGTWKAWLTTITRNTALNLLRQNRNTNTQQELTEDIPSTSPTPEEVVIRQEQKADIVRVVNPLPNDEKLLFYRKYYYLQSTAQIASELGTTE